MNGCVRRDLLGRTQCRMTARWRAALNRRGETDMLELEWGQVVSFVMGGGFAVVCGMVRAGFYRVDGRQLLFSNLK